MLFILYNLKNGGNCVIKHYTFFEKYTLVYLMLFSKLFKECYIYKPFSSKSLNSEVYIVGLGFNDTNKNPAIRQVSKINFFIFLFIGGSLEPLPWKCSPTKIHNYITQ